MTRTTMRLHVVRTSSGSGQAALCIRGRHECPKLSRSMLATQLLIVPRRSSPPGRLPLSWIFFTLQPRQNSVFSTGIAPYNGSCTV